MMNHDSTWLAMLKAFPGMGSVCVQMDTGHFQAIFDNGFIEQSLGAGIESLEPTLMARSSDVARLSLAKDTALTVGDETYRVKRLEPDGTGMTRVVLKR